MRYLLLNTLPVYSNETRLIMSKYLLLLLVFFLSISCGNKNEKSDIDVQKGSSGPEEFLENIKTDIFQAQDTMKGMLDSKDKMDMLVPVGHNTSIFANVEDLDRVLVGIGSRVYMETTRKDSLARLDKRLEDLNKASKTYNENLVKAEQEYMAVRERADYLSSNPEAK